MKLWKFILSLFKPRICPYCGGTGVVARIHDPVTGRVLKLPCRWCDGED